MSIDDLAHDAEIEAEVLRAVAHMPAARAQEFLIAVVLKIRRAHSPASRVTLTAPRLLASSLVAVRVDASREKDDAASSETLPRTQQVLTFVASAGRVTSIQIMNALATNTLERERYSNTISFLRRRGDLVADGDHYYVPVGVKVDA